VSGTRAGSVLYHAVIISSLVVVRYEELRHWMMAKHLYEIVTVLVADRSRVRHGRSDSLHVELSNPVHVNLLDMLLKIPLVLCLKVAERTVVDNIMMLCLDMLLHISYLGIFIITEVTFVFDPLMLPIHVPFQRTFVNCNEITELAVEPDATVD